MQQAKRTRWYSIVCYVLRSFIFFRFIFIYWCVCCYRIVVVTSFFSPLCPGLVVVVVIFFSVSCLRFVNFSCFVNNRHVKRANVCFDLFSPNAADQERETEQPTDRTHACIFEARLYAAAVATAFKDSTPYIAEDFSQRQYIPYWDWDWKEKRQRKKRMQSLIFRGTQGSYIHTHTHARATKKEEWETKRGKNTRKQQQNK